MLIVTITITINIAIMITVKFTSIPLPFFAVQYQQQLQQKFGGVRGGGGRGPMIGGELGVNAFRTGRGGGAKEREIQNARSAPNPTKEMRHPNPPALPAFRRTRTNGVPVCKP